MELLVDDYPHSQTIFVRGIVSQARCLWGKNNIWSVWIGFCRGGTKKLKAVVNVMRNEQLQYLYHCTMMLLISKK